MQGDSVTEAAASSYYLSRRGAILRQFAVMYHPF